MPISLNISELPNSYKPTIWSTSHTFQLQNAGESVYHMPLTRFTLEFTRVCVSLSGFRTFTTLSAYFEDWARPSTRNTIDKAQQKTGGAHAFTYIHL